MVLSTLCFSFLKINASICLSYLSHLIELWYVDFEMSFGTKTSGYRQYEIRCQNTMLVGVLLSSENGRFWEPAGDFVGRSQCGKKSKIEEVFCGFACYPSEEVLLDARSQPGNQSPPDAARGKHEIR